MSTEPCGSLPVVHLGVGISYCVHHMAWSATISTHRQTGEDDLEHLDSHRATFGPFDAWEDVQRWVVERLWDPSVIPA